MFDSDPLLAWRAEFPTLDTCTYLVSHSLGAMPRRASEYLQQFATEWASRGVRAWHEGWWEIGRTTGDLLAPIIGARMAPHFYNTIEEIDRAIDTLMEMVEGTRGRVPRCV